MADEEFAGSVATTNEGAGGDVEEAQAFGKGLKVLKGSGRDVLVDTEVVRGRLKVLAEREKVDMSGAKITHGLHEFLFSFTEAEHDGRLGVDSRVEFLDGFEDTKGLVVSGAGIPYPGGKGASGFDVVVEDVGMGMDNGAKSVKIVLEVGNEDFDEDMGVFVADGPDSLGEVLRPAVGEVITVDGGEDDVVEVKLLESVGDVMRFEGVDKAFGIAGFDVAEAAATGTGVPEKHDGGGAAAPAFVEVGAVGFFANGVEV